MSIEPSRIRRDPLVHGMGTGRVLPAPVGWRGLLAHADERAFMASAAHNRGVSDSPIPRTLRPALSAVVDRLVAGDYEGLKRDGIDPYVDSDLGLWIREYGRAPGTDEPGRATLVPLPEEAWESADVIFEDPGPPRVWRVVVDLWTAEEGRSDLSMEAEVTETSNGLAVIVADIHVM